MENFTEIRFGARPGSGKMRFHTPNTLPTSENMLMNNYPDLILRKVIPTTRFPIRPHTRVSNVLGRPDKRVARQTHIVLPTDADLPAPNVGPLRASASETILLTPDVATLSCYFVRCVVNIDDVR
jgi:hypothetical protein